MPPVIPPEIAAKIVLLVILAPAAALYDFVTNPAAPPQIFAAQFEEGFGRPPRPIIPRPPIVRPIRKHVTVTRPEHA